MKRVFLPFALTSLGALAALAATPKATVTIPFDFQIQNMNLKAGDYTIHEITPGGAVKLRARTGEAVIVQTVRAGRWYETRAPKLVFSEENGSRQLREIWTGADGTGYVLTATE